MVRRLRQVLVLAGLIVAVGCGEGEGGGTVVRDSAGVTIVENNPARPAWGEGGWRIADVPVISVGDEEAPVGFVPLRGITYVHLLPSGDLAVADGEGRQVLIYGPNGEFLRSVGRGGDGPGEFRSPYVVYAHPGDSLLVFDLYRSVLVFDREGRWGRNFVPAGVVGYSQGIPKREFGDGTLLFARYQIEQQQPEPGLRRSEVELARIDRAGAVVQSFGLFEEQTVNYGSPQFYLYGPWGHMTAGPDALWYSPGDRVDVERHALADGSLRLIRLALPVRPVTPADVATDKAAMMERYAGLPQAAAMERMYEDALVAPVFPAHGALLVDDANYLWVSEFRPWVLQVETPWHVFDPEGRYLGAVVMPAGLYVDQIVGDRVVGRHTDEDGLQTARVYRIEGR